MNAGDLYALDQAMQRLDHAAAVVRLLSDLPALSGATSEALRCIDEAITDNCETIDGILQPHRVAMSGCKPNANAL